jgi:O-acetyl-ADP-ribose deacetylase (regulator of RNase III)
MIRYTSGNLLQARAEALVNTVNEVGVMGKGVALMFSEAYPDNAKAYEIAAKAKKVKVGRMLVTKTHELVGPQFIINFPTKKHWRQPSRLEWVHEGLKSLVGVIRKHGITSVAVPPLGCGNGGLQWDQVRLEIEAAAALLPDVDFIVYEPTDAYQNAPKRAGVEALTIPRALIAELVRRYSVLGLECTNLEVQKLAWFLHRSIVTLRLPDPLSLNFGANTFGPYSDQLRHLLNGLDGSYLHSEKRLSDAGPLDLIWFEDSKRATVKAYLDSDEALRYREALEATASTIDGFESPLGMELLATVDWLLTEASTEPTVPALRGALAAWPGGRAAAQRKRRLFDERLLSLALERLRPKESDGNHDAALTPEQA